MKRVLVTGSSGYVAQVFIRELKKQHPKAKVMGVDLQPVGKGGEEPDVFVRKDTRNKGLSVQMVDFQPNTVVHLAFIVKPMHDEAVMHDINIGGSENLFRIMSTLPIPPTRVLVASSATAYGARSSNPQTGMDEEYPLNAQDPYSYARDKQELEKLTKRFAEHNKKVHVSWIRPCIILGPGVSNFLSDGILKASGRWTPWLGHDTPFQFVHEVDVAHAIISILENNGSGPFNVAPPDSIKTTDMAKESGRKLLYVPYWFLFLLITVLWMLKIAQTPPSVLNFHRYPWVVKPNRLEELKFQFSYSSKDTLKDFLEHRLGTKEK